jgi:hypothetical protein
MVETEGENVDEIEGEGVDEIEGVDDGEGERETSLCTEPELPRFGHSRVRLFPGSVIPGFGCSRLRSFPGSVVPGFGHPEFGRSRVRSFPTSKILGLTIHVICTPQSILFVTFSHVTKIAEPGNSRSRYILLLITLSQATRMSEV